MKSFHINPESEYPAVAVADGSQFQFVCNTCGRQYKYKHNLHRHKKFECLCCTCARYDIGLLSRQWLLQMARSSSLFVTPAGDSTSTNTTSTATRSTNVSVVHVLDMT
ncbi:hypothetical protein J6590_014873 [Homalodisca vitripennis]|nr:hypothetical protein J6590_014873 [Homalodisca vitripennis]